MATTLVFSTLTNGTYAINETITTADFVIKPEGGKRLFIVDSRINLGPPVGPVALGCGSTPFDGDRIAFDLINPDLRWQFVRSEQVYYAGNTTYPPETDNQRMVFGVVTVSGTTRYIEGSIVPQAVTAASATRLELDAPSAGVAFLAMTYELVSVAVEDPIQQDESSAVTPAVPHCSGAAFATRSCRQGC